MMKYLLVCLTILFLLSACSQNDLVQKKALDLSNMDMSVSPGDDFYQYANGNWLKNHPVPDDYSRYGSFEVLREKNLIDLRTIMTKAAKSKNTPKGSNLQKIGDFYATGMDVKTIEKAGLSPLRSDFEQIDAISSIQEVQELIAQFHLKRIAPLFFFFAEQDLKNSDMNIGWLYQGGLGLPDRDYYLEQNPPMKDIREKYIAHLERMFQLIGDSEDIAKSNAETIMTMETRLANVSMTRVEQRDPKAIYNPMTLAKLQENSGNMDWAAYFEAMGISESGTINNAQPEFFKEVSRMLRDVSIDDWKTYLRWTLINDTAEFLSLDFENADFDFYGKVLSGTEELQPRWKRVLNNTSASLGEAVGQLYIEEFFPPAAKERAVELVMNLKYAYGERIKNLDWMSDTTKAKALEKLAAFGVKIGYPDKWRDYSTLEIDRSSYVRNVMNANIFNKQYNLNKINKPVDKSEWHMSPQTVNAYYNPGVNEIVFPAAILQPPFFNFKADDPVNYGAIGGVIGHEMTHGFDDQGRQYDKEGNLNDWWTTEDLEKFNELTQVLVDQANNYAVIDTNTINGQLTLGENIADLGGLTIAFDALKLAMAKNPPKSEIDGFTAEQRFYLSWAQVWRSNIRVEEQLKRLKTDVHSPSKYRTNGPISNLTDFHNAFDVKEGQAMYRSPETVAKVW